LRRGTICTSLVFTFSLENVAAIFSQCHQPFHCNVGEYSSLTDKRMVANMLKGPEGKACQKANSLAVEHFNSTHSEDGRMWDGE
jgi:hypothetical protein